MPKHPHINHSPAPQEEQECICYNPTLSFATGTWHCTTCGLEPSEESITIEAVTAHLDRNAHSALAVGLSRFINKEW